MKSVAKMTDAEYKATVSDLRQRAAGGKNTLGFYIQLMFLAGAAVTIVQMALGESYGDSSPSSASLSYRPHEPSSGNGLKTGFRKTRRRVT